MWTIHQPKPRAASPRTLTHLILIFIFLLTFTLKTETFYFLNESPGNHIQNQLPTPSSSPDPRPSARRLSIPDLISTDEHFGRNNTLQTAVDTFEKAALPGDAVLMFDQTEEGEYLLSARPWEVGECRRANQELWGRLEGWAHPRAPSSPLVCDQTARPVALSYLTPPSSPEPVRKCDLAPVAHVDPLIVPEPAPEAPVPFNSLDFTSTVPADPPSNESLEYLSDYDYDYDGASDAGDDWVIESPLTHPEGLPECTPEPIYTAGSNNDMAINRKCPISPALPMICPSFNELKLPMPCRLPEIPDLTSQLDVPKFSEWPVARGGFGEVWKGALVSNSAPAKKGRPIAVKRLTTYAAAGEEGAKKTIKRTSRELAIWSQLKHPNILPLLGTCSFRGGIGLVSEWQENGNATEWVRANPGTDRLRLCEGICRGLTYLHDTGIVHGDLRGANVLICDTGKPRLIDFGLASITNNSQFSASSTLAGTLRWMAPELQVTEGQGTTTAGDMFAFGMTMLELFTGLPPFSAVRNDIAVLLKYQKGERPPRPSRTGRNVKGLNRNRIAARANVPRDRDETRDVCVPMDDETWHEVERCWDQEPSLRPSASKMLDWFMWKKKRRP